MPCIIDEPPPLADLASNYWDAAENIRQAVDAHTWVSAVICDYDLGLADPRNGVEICTALAAEYPGPKYFILSGLEREVPEWMACRTKDRLFELIQEVSA